MTTIVMVAVVAAAMAVAVPVAGIAQLLCFLHFIHVYFTVLFIKLNKKLMKETGC